MPIMILQPTNFVQKLFIFQANKLKKVEQNVILNTQMYTLCGLIEAMKHCMVIYLVYSRSTTVVYYIVY